MFQKILEWADARNLILGASAKSQTLKLTSELGEFCDAVLKNDIAGIKDGIGDMAVVLAIVSKQSNTGINSFGIGLISPVLVPVQDYCLLLVESVGYLSKRVYREQSSAGDFKEVLHRLALIANFYGLTFEECIESAYNEIKDRKGIMFNGAFIKESDPRFQDALAQLAATITQ